MLRSFKPLLSIILCTAITTGCLSTENSSSTDRPLSGEGSQEFLAARQVIYDSCRNCHQYHNLTEEQLITSGVVIPGDSANSRLYYRMYGSLGPEGPKNMPENSSISVEDVEIVAAWIDSIQ